MMMIEFETPEGSKVYVIEGKVNTDRRLPENLGAITQDGDGVYNATEPVWGELFSDVAKKISIETASGGLLFFDDSDFSPERFRKTMELLDVGHCRGWAGKAVEAAKEYTAFICSSENPRKDRYLSQLRFVSSFAMKFYYKRKDLAERIEKNPMKLDYVKFMISFIKQEIERYNSESGKRLLRAEIRATGEECGSFGFGFGFLVENKYYGIYRLWSRPVFYSK